MVVLIRSAKTQSETPSSVVQDCVRVWLSGVVDQVSQDPVRDPLSTGQDCIRVWLSDDVDQCKRL